MKFYCEKHIGISTLYFGNLDSFRIGAILGRNTHICLGVIQFGIDLW